jgi:two-component system response regulator HydG
MQRDRGRVIVVDDKLELAETLADGLEARGFTTVALRSGKEARVRLEAGAVDALVTDLRMPDLDGLELLAASRALDPHRPVIVMTAYGAIDTAVESIRRGAYHYLTKPFQVDELEIFLARALDERKVREEASALRTTLRERYSPAGFIGRGPGLQRVLEIACRVARTDTPVLLYGETGTGKSAIAKLVHAESPRAARPMVSINCAALPEALLESELFGHVRGAFTGATADRQGLVAEAEGGTLFLDEIGEMPMSLQAKMLHVLEARTVRPVGSSKERVVDVRILAATHRDLRERVRAGTFREDLLYRLDVVAIEIPPLRERREDLPELIAHFLGVARARHPESPVVRLAPDALAALVAHAWPGNVRELQHVLERVVVFGRGPEVTRDDLPPTVLESESPTDLSFGATVIPVRELQRRYAQWALERCGGHRGETAEKLGIDGKTLAKWLAG